MTDETKIIEIKNRLKCYEPDKPPYAERKKRLKGLADEHGIKATALAAGLTEATLRQYIGSRYTQPISENPVSQAETILKGL